jgi:hypothetical protein
LTQVGSKTSGPLAPSHGCPVLSGRAHTAARAFCSRRMPMTAYVRRAVGRVLGPPRSTKQRGSGSCVRRGCTPRRRRSSRRIWPSTIGRRRRLSIPISKTGVTDRITRPKSGAGGDGGESAQVGTKRVPADRGTKRRRRRKSRNRNNTALKSALEAKLPGVASHGCALDSGREER